MAGEVHVDFRISPDLKDRILRAAERERRSWNTQAALLLEQAITVYEFESKQLTKGLH